VDETDDGMLWNGSEEDGNVRSEREEDENTDCEDRDNDILTGKFRYNLACFVYYMHAIKSKIFFLAGIFFWGGGGFFRLG